MTKPAPWPQSPPSDPFRDEPCPPSGFADYRASGGTLSEREYLDAANAFLEALGDVHAGTARAQAAHASLASQARVLRVDRADRNEAWRTLRPSARLPSLEMLIRITTDLFPTAATEAADRVLGPLADDLDVRNPVHRRTAQVAVAAIGFSLADGAMEPDRRGAFPGFTPLQRWSRRKPLPDVTDRAIVRAVAQAPVAVWSLEHATEDGWHLEGRVGLAAHCQPTNPVQLVEVAAPYRPPRAGDTLVARVVHTRSGWQATTGVVFPGAPPSVRIQTWVQLALWEARLRDRRLTVEDLLRRGGHRLYRAVSEWAWLHGDDDPYRDPQFYDLEYADHVEDLAHYTRLATASGGPVLELGCGTGRLTLALATAGLEVDGVDLSPAMLRGCRQRIERAQLPVGGRVRVRQADFCALSLDRRYPLVIWPFNALHHCRDPSRIQAVLSGVHRHLLPTGRLAVDCYLPDIELYDRDPAARAEPRRFVHPRSGETLESWEQGWWDADLQVHHVIYVYRQPDGTETHSHLQLRMYELEVLRQIFLDAGWRILSEAEDFEGTPIGDRPLKWVGLLAPPRGD